jgi:hypothetical protein
VGEGHDTTGPPSATRVSVHEAAGKIGTTVDAIRKRVQRDTIAYEKDTDGRVWILLDADRTRHATDQDATGHRQDLESSALISEMRERLEFLERELEVRSEEIRRRDTIIMNMTEAMKALNPPPRDAGPQAPPEGRETVSEGPDRAEQPQSASEAGGAQGGSERRSWWGRVFGGG